jgi:hypothetical protein
MKTCFDNIVKMKLEDTDILGMISNEGEYVKFHKARIARGNIEKWLNDVQDEMISTLRKLLKDGNKEYMDPTKPLDRKVFILGKESDPEDSRRKGQIVATVA